MFILTQAYNAFFICELLIMIHTVSYAAPGLNADKRCLRCRPDTQVREAFEMTGDASFTFVTP